MIPAIFFLASMYAYATKHSVIGTTLLLATIFTV
jgi:hypothetical protein